MTFSRKSLAPDDQISAIVSRILRIESTIWGTHQNSFVVRFNGTLYGDSMDAYDQLTTAIKPHKLIPLFRIENEQHAIILVNAPPKSKLSNPWVNLFLFVLTLFSMLLAGALYNYSGPVSGNFLTDLRHIFFILNKGWPFAASMLGILLAHEFGHYLAARYHKTDVTLPYFIPFPLSPLGTLGAFIRLKTPPKNKRILLDIGLAGPLAGLVIAIPVLFYGLATSEVHRLPLSMPPGQVFEGNSLLYLGIKYLVHGQWLPTPSTYGNIHPVLHWIRYYFSGLPLPIGGLDVSLNDVAWAGWAGLLVTSLNLIPVGQLDGGHISYVLFGRQARKFRPVILGILLILGIFWSGWWLWAVMIFILGQTHAEPLDQITSLDTNRKAIAIFGLLIFILVFIPVPLISIQG
ncbi:MAG: site-2 protease family protein [Chloroflexi bacterium]|nr:site-2 protease family protein [Chloroflexota bacterium]